MARHSRKSKASRKSRMSKKSKPVRIQLRKGVLGQFGYSTSKTALARHRALKKACQEEGCLPILRRVNVLATFNKRNPSLYKLYRSDVEWLKKEYQLEK